MKEYKITDYQAYCLECGAPLINMGEFFIHPTHTNCSEEDGIIVKQTLEFSKWYKKYGKPEKAVSKIFEELISELNTNSKEIDRLDRLVVKLKKEKQKAIKQNNDALIKLLDLEGKWFVRLYRWYQAKAKAINTKIKSLKN
jgi:hypothetical protein